MNSLPMCIQTGHDSLMKYILETKQKNYLAKTKIETMKNERQFSGVSLRWNEQQQEQITNYSINSRSSKSIQLSLSTWENNDASKNIVQAILQIIRVLWPILFYFSLAKDGQREWKKTTTNKVLNSET